MDKDTTLYHYTDYRALDGILREGILRVNNVLNMNDAAEMRLFITGICQGAYDGLLKEGLSESAKNIKKLFDEELESEFQYSAYAACFSTLKDDAAQWERYGNKGRGVCIGMSQQILSRIASFIGPISLQKVYYRSDMSSHPLAKKFVELARTLGELKKDMPEVREYLELAWLSSAAFKHPSFKNESEVRMAVSPLYSGMMNVSPDYHITEGRIKKYYPLEIKRCMEEMGLRLDELIECIIIGPESTQSKPILIDYLNDNGMSSISDRVYSSECPLRRPVA